MEDVIKLRALRAPGGENVRIICPLCSPNRKPQHQKERTMAVKRDRRKILYSCHHCGQGGTVPLTDKPKVVIKTDPPTPAHMAYLKSRGISESTAARFGLVGGKRFIPALQREVPVLGFPYYEDGDLTAIKFRSIEEKGFTSQGAAQSFFGIDLLEEGYPVIICEGEIDALSFAQAGIRNAISVPNGAPAQVREGKVTPSEDGKFSFVWRGGKSALEGFGPFIIATDADGPGLALGEEIARRLGKGNCHTVEWPAGLKDANDVLQHHGAQGLLKLVQSAAPWPVAGLYDAFHYADDVTDLYVRGHGHGLSTGFPSIDSLYTVAPGQMTIVTGVPSSGKSEFIDALMVNLAEREHMRFAVCSFENPPPTHIAKLVEKRVRKPFFSGPTQRMTEMEMRLGMDWVQEHFTFLEQANGDAATIEDVLARGRAAVQRIGARGMIIDPYNYIDMRLGKDASETQKISDMLTAVKTFATANDVHVWFVAHPQKMMRHEGNIPVPKGYDISGSAAWFAKADVGLTVHRPTPDDTHSEVEVHVWKCRFRWVGKQGKALIGYDPVCGRYIDSLGEVKEAGDADWDS